MIPFYARYGKGDTVNTVHIELFSLENLGKYCKLNEYAILYDQKGDFTDYYIRRYIIWLFVEIAAHPLKKI